MNFRWAAEDDEIGKLDHEMTHKIQSKVLENRISTTYPLGVESAVTLSLEFGPSWSFPKDVIYFLKGMIKSFLQWPLSPFQSFSVLSPFLSCASQQDGSANPTFPHVCVYPPRYSPTCLKAFYLQISNPWLKIYQLDFGSCMNMSFSSQNWSTRLGFCSRSVQFCIQSAPWHHLLHNSHSFRSPPSPASRVLSWLRVQSQRGKNSLHNVNHIK